MLLLVVLLRALLQKTKMQPLVRKKTARLLCQSNALKQTETVVRVGRHLQQLVACVEHCLACEAEYRPIVANVDDNTHSVVFSSGQG